MYYAINSKVFMPSHGPVVLNIFFFLVLKTGRLVIVAKGFLKLPNLHMLIKQKNPSLPRNLVFGTFGKLPIVFSTKLNLLYLLCSMTWKSCLHNSGISSPVFPSRTNLKLHNISVTPKMVRRS